MTRSSRRFPAIERVPPKLARRAEIVRWNPCKGTGVALLIQAKQLRMSPYISAVVSDVDGDVAHDSYSETTAVGL